MPHMFPRDYGQVSMCDRMGEPGGRCMLDTVCLFHAACKRLARDKFREAGYELPSRDDTEGGWS